MLRMFTTLRIPLAVAAVAVVLGGCADFAGRVSSPVVRSSPSAAAVRIADGVLVDANGMTLYTFDRDVRGSGSSACNGPCAANWPPLPATAGIPPGDFSIISRENGMHQLAYKGRPLYRWVKDTRPGQRSGDGINKVWRVARP